MAQIIELERLVQLRTKKRIEKRLGWKWEDMSDAAQQRHERYLLNQIKQRMEVVYGTCN